MESTTKTTLIEAAVTAVRTEEQSGSEARWKLGEVACQWRALGETDATLATAISRSRSLVTCAAIVWTRFGASRRTALTWAHHKVVVSLDDAESRLTEAESRHLSARALARLIAEQHSRDAASQLATQLRRIKALARRLTAAELKPLAQRLRRAETAVRLRIEQTPPPPS